VIDVNNINSFKNKLEKFWANENVKFNWRSPGPKKVQVSTRPCEVVVAHAWRAREREPIQGAWGQSPQ